MLVSAAWIVPAILGAVNAVAQQRLGDGSWPDAAAVLFASLDWLVYGLLTPAVFVVARKWPLARPRLARHLAVQLGLSLVFCVAWAGAGAILRLLLMPEALGGSVGMHFVSWLFITLPFGVAVYLGVVGIEHAIRYFAEARDRELQMTRLSEQLSSARFAALQAQVNPHFLFNTLNTIAVLVRDGETSDATRIIERLSDVLRRTLSRHQSNEVRLEEELELVRQYLDIEQMRFSDRLRVTYDVDHSVLSAAVPSFALQHLVENAIRHGIARATNAGRVIVRARKIATLLELTVEDDGPGIGDSPIPAAHGIEQTRERLRALYGPDASLDVLTRREGGTRAALRVPYRELAANTNGNDSDEDDGAE